MALAVIAVIVLLALLPTVVRPGPRWELALAGVLLAALIVADPGRINRRTRVEWLLSLALLIVLIASALVAAGLLIYALVVGNAELTKSGARLLLVGNDVWVANAIVFGLLYWEADGGGSAARASHDPPHPDLAFPQHTSPELASPGWRPLFLDYLYLGFTNALAFSPTDVMPLARWAKAAMLLQSLISLAVLGLVIARAVNIFA